MSRRIKLVANDSQPAVLVSMTDHDSGLPIDVSAATTVLKFRADGKTTLIATLTGTKLVGLRNPDGTIDSSNATVGAGGRVSFAWGSALAGLSAGQYEGEIQITYADTTVQTPYEILKFTVREDF